jgi:hypothetical protein
MRRFLFTLLGCAGFLGGSAPLVAQTFIAPPPSTRIAAPYSRPTVSPYVNLLRGGSAGINYYGIVRPELETRSSIQQLQRQVGQTQAEVTQATTPSGLPTTGHPTVFFNYSHYFGTSPPTTPSARPTPAVPTLTPAPSRSRISTTRRVIPPHLIGW